MVMPIFHHITVATDLGPASRKATDLALRMARDAQAELTIVHVFEIPVWGYESSMCTAADVVTPLLQAAEAELATELARVRTEYPRARSSIRRGIVAEEVLLEADDRATDLLVVGTHGRSGVAHAVMGSVAERLVRTSRIPVLTVRSAA